MFSMALPSRLRIASSAAAASTVRSFSSTRHASLARMQIIGRLAAPPEVVNTASGSEMIRFSLATSSGPRSDRQTSWYRVASFATGPRKEFLLNMEKGTLMYVEAECRLRLTEDSNSGARIPRLDLTEKNFEALSKPRPVESASADSEGEMEEDHEAVAGRS